MEFNYEVLNYIPHESRIFVSYKPVDTTLTPHGIWIGVSAEMTEEQIKELIINVAPLHIWETPVSEAAKNLQGFQTTEPVNRTIPNNAPTVAAIAKNNRDVLLYESDWTVMPDSPLSEAKLTEWKAYRQALRDIPQQPGFPDNIQWPEVPLPSWAE